MNENGGVMKKVLVVMGSDSDFPVVSGCLDELEKFGIDYECRVISAHRTPNIAIRTAEEAEQNGFGVIIAAAGKAAHLGGVLAAATILPVIGIPIHSTALSGADALYSIVQMPPGVPVASMAIDGAVNAAIFAAQILSQAEGCEILKRRLREHKENIANKVIDKDRQLQNKIKEKNGK